MSEKKPEGGSKEDPMQFLRGKIAEGHLDEVAKSGLAFHAAVRAKYDPHPSTGACTDKGICTAGILCLITEGKGRVGCGPTGVFRTDCPVIGRL